MNIFAGIAIYSISGVVCRIMCVRLARHIQQERGAYSFHFDLPAHRSINWQHEGAYTYKSKARYAMVVLSACLAFWWIFVLCAYTTSLVSACLCENAPGTWRKFDNVNIDYDDLYDLSPHLAEQAIRTRWSA
jgi:hypothetical protein